MARCVALTGVKLIYWKHIKAFVVDAKNTTCVAFTSYRKWTLLLQQMWEAIWGHSQLWRNKLLIPTGSKTGCKRDPICTERHELPFLACAGKNLFESSFGLESCPCSTIEELNLSMDQQGWHVVLDSHWPTNFGRVRLESYCHVEDAIADRSYSRRVWCLLVVQIS